MRKRPMDSDEANTYLTRDLPGLVEVRRFTWGRVLCGTWSGVPAVVVQEWWDRTPKNTVYEYDTIDEQQADVGRVIRFGRGGSDGGAAGAGMPVAPVPPPPALAAGDTKPVPDRAPQ